MTMVRLKCSSHVPPRDSGHVGHERVSSAPHFPEIQGTGISKHDKGGGIHGGMCGGMCGGMRGGLRDGMRGGMELIYTYVFHVRIRARVSM